eukprot:gene29006-biopygen32884
MDGGHLLPASPSISVQHVYYIGTMEETGHVALLFEDVAPLSENVALLSEDQRLGKISRNDRMLEATNSGYGSSDPHKTILQQCPALQRVSVLGASERLTLAGLPPSLRAIQVQLKPGQQSTQEVEELTGLQMSAALSPLTALSHLEEAVLHGFPNTSLAALQYCTALRSLDLKSWHFLANISALSECCHLQDIAALSGCCNLQTLSLTLDLSSCGQLHDITALSSCSKLQTCKQLQDIANLPACCNLHTGLL